MAASLIAASLASSAKSQVKASVDSAKGKFAGKKGEDKDKKGDDEGDDKRKDRKDKVSPRDIGEGDDAAAGDEEAGEPGSEARSSEKGVQVKVTDKTITDKAFFKLEERRKAAMEEQPLLHKKTDESAKHWEFPRRWKVRLWDIRFRNLSVNEVSVFLCFMFGGDMVEYYVRRESGNPSIWRIGEQGTVYRTHAVQKIQPADKDSHEYDVEFTRGRAEIVLELSMSYKDIGDKKLRCEVWDWGSWGLNQLNCYYEQVLYDYATGNTFWEHEMINADEKQQQRSKVSFQLAFEEIYDWELCLMNWKATDLPGEADPDILNDEDGSVAMGAMDSVDGAARKDSPSEETTLAVSKKPKESRMTAKRLNVSLFNKGLRKDQTVRSMKANAFDRVLWEVLGTCCYRGTVSELEDENMVAWITSHNFTNQFEANISLAGVLNYGYCKGELIPNDSALASMRGKLEGRVSIPSMPLYRQAVVATQLKSGSRYLLVKILRAGNVSVPFSRRFDALDTFVSLTYDGHSFVTNTCLDNNTPSFKDEMAFDLRLVSSIKENIESEMVGKGPLQLDLWSVGKLGNDHLGGVDIYIRDVLFLPNSMEKQKLVTKTQKNPVTGAQEEYGTRCFMGKKTLVGAKHPDCYIQLDACFSPDFEEHFALPIKDEAPKDKEEYYKSRWETHMKEIAEKGDPTRNFRLYAQNHRMQNYLLPSFLSALKPPMQMHNLKTINHYVASIPFDAEKKADGAWAAPSFLSMANKGSIIDHCLLHASLLLGLPARAFVCLGTTWNNEPHAWVVTLGEKLPHQVGGGAAAGGLGQQGAQFVTPMHGGVGNANTDSRWKACQHSLCLGLRRCMHCMSRTQDPIATDEDAVETLQQPLQAKASVQKRDSARGTRRGAVGAIPRLTIRGMKRDQPVLSTTRSNSRSGLVRDDTYAGLNGHRVHAAIWDTSLRAVYELPSSRIAHQSHALEVARANVQPTVNCTPAELDNELRLRKKEQLDDKHEKNIGPAEMAVDWFHPHPIKFHQLAPVPPPPSAYECTNCYMDIRVGSKPCYACDTCGAMFCWRCCQGVYSDAAIDAEEVDFTAPVRFNEQVILPYKTIEVMFNHANLWANLQHQNPGSIYYDVWNPMYWYKFAPSDSFSFTAHFARDSPMRPPIQESKLLDMRRQIEEAINLAIQTGRSECSRTTVFSRDSHTAEILRQGLEVYEIGIIMGANTAGHDLKKKWLQFLYSKVPQDHKMVAWPLLFNFAHPDAVANAAMEHLERSAFNEPNAVFSTAAHLRGWPNGIITVFVYILLIQPAPPSTRTQPSKIATLNALSDRDSQDLPMDADGVTFDIALGPMKRKATFALVDSVDDLSQVSDESELIGMGNRNPSEIKEEVIGIMRDLAQIKRELDEGGDEKAEEDETDVHRHFLWANIMCLPMNPDSQIELDQSRMEATISPDPQGTFSFLISEGPVPQDDECGGYSFRLQIQKVTKKCEKSEDNFCIGCTTQSVEQVWRNKPTGIENIKGASAVGFEGMMYTSDTDKWAQIEWNASTLREGDVLRFWVNTDGESSLFVNDVLVCNGPDQIDVDNQIFAIVSIVGRVEGIRLLPSDFNRLDAVSFFLGRHIEQSGNSFWKAHPGKPAEKLGDAENPPPTILTDEELLEECGILCDYILPRFPGSGYYFEVIIEKSLGISDIGLAIGVTTIPQKYEEVPNRLGTMEYTWMMGYDGLLQTEGKPWIIDEFLSARLRVNDVIGVLIELTGAMEIMVNGHVIARSANATIPVHSSIYPAVDLTGNTLQISLNFECKPFKIAPICTGWVDPNFIGMAHVATLTEDDTVMTQRTQNLPLLLCLGDAPMTLATHDFFFQIEIMETQTDVTNHHGFVIGCTGVGYDGPTRAKLSGASHVRTIDKWHTEETLLILDNHVFDGSSENFFEHNWDFALKKGDMLTFVLTAECVVFLLVNDVMVVGAETAFEIRPVYPIVDIRGTIKSCKLVHCAPPRWKFSAMGQHVHAEENAVWTIPELEGFTGVVHSSALDESMSYKVTILGYGVQEGEEDYYPPLPNGIALGVCHANQVDIPITLDFLCNNIFLIGFDGQIWDGERWTVCDWDTRDLREDDIVQIDIRGPQLVVLVNEKQVCVAPFTLQRDLPLFPCMDLFAGFGVEVTMPSENVMYRAPLPMRPLHVPYARLELKDDFSDTNSSHILCMGHNVSNKAKVFKRKVDGGDDHNGIILSTPLGTPPTSFSLQIRNIDADKNFAPILGVCVVHDPFTLTIPPMIDGLDCVWCIGYDGQLYDSSTMSWNRDVALDPSTLEINDFLTLTITRELRMQLSINGKDVSYEAPIVPDPASVHLFPCFDLFGCARKVMLTYDADHHGGGFCMRRHGQSISAFGMRDSLSLYDQLALKTPNFASARDDEDDEDEELDSNMAPALSALKMLSSRRKKSKWAEAFAATKDEKGLCADIRASDGTVGDSRSVTSTTDLDPTGLGKGKGFIRAVMGFKGSKGGGGTEESSTDKGIFGAFASLRNKGAFRSAATKSAMHSFLAKGGKKGDGTPSSKGSGASQALSLWQKSPLGFGSKASSRFQFARLKTGVSGLLQEGTCEVSVGKLSSMGTIAEKADGGSLVVKRWQSAFQSVKEQRLVGKSQLCASPHETSGLLSTMVKGRNRWQSAALLAHKKRMSDTPPVAPSPELDIPRSDKPAASLAPANESALGSSASSHRRKGESEVRQDQPVFKPSGLSVAVHPPRDTIPIPLTSCLLGEGIKLSDTYPDKRVCRAGKYFCGILSTIPLPTNNPSFHVTIVTVDKEQMQGFIVGVTTHSRMNIPSMMCDSSALWALGYDGQLWDGGSVCDWYEDERCWDPTTLVSGDKIRFTVINHSKLEVHVNDRQVASEKMSLPQPPVPLYPFVDLFTGGVTDMTTFHYCYEAGEEPPPMLDAQAPEITTVSIYAAAYAEGTGIRASLIVPHLRECPSMRERMSSQINIFATIGPGVSVKGHVITKIDDDACCCLIGARPLGAASFFEILVESIMANSDSVGVVLGVTTKPTLDPDAVFNGEDDVWCIGYDGQTLDGPSGTWESIKWDPSDIMAGDYVGCEAIDGELRLWMNGAVVAVGPRTVPGGTHLFPIIHMYGHILRFAFVPPDENDDEDDSCTSPNKAALARRKMASPPKQLSMDDNDFASAVSPERRELHPHSPAMGFGENPMDYANTSLLSPSPLSWSPQKVSSKAPFEQDRNTELGMLETSMLRASDLRDTRQISGQDTAFSGSTVERLRLTTNQPSILTITSEGNSPLAGEGGIADGALVGEKEEYSEDGAAESNGKDLGYGEVEMSHAYDDEDENIFVSRPPVAVIVVTAAGESAQGEEGREMGAEEQRGRNEIETQDPVGTEQFTIEQDQERRESSVDERIKGLQVVEVENGELESARKTNDEKQVDSTGTEEGSNQNNAGGDEVQTQMEDDDVRRTMEQTEEANEQNVVRGEDVQKFMQNAHSFVVGEENRDAKVEDEENNKRIQSSATETNLYEVTHEELGSETDEQGQTTHLDKQQRVSNADNDAYAEAPMAREDDVVHDSASRSMRAKMDLTPNLRPPDPNFDIAQIQSLSLQATRQSDVPPRHSRSGNDNGNGKGNRNGNGSKSSSSSSTSSPSSHGELLPRRMTTESFSDAFGQVGLGVQVKGPCCTKIGESMCNVIGSEPLLSARYFTILIDDIDDNPAVGPVLGVSLERNFELPSVLSDMPHLWCIGYDGQMWDGGQKEWAEISWSPEKLRKGDAMGCKVTPSTFELYINDIIMSSVNATIPHDVPLYPVIDLLDQVRQITFCRNPPIIPVSTPLTAACIPRSNLFALCGAGVEVKGASVACIKDSYCGVIARDPVLSTAGFELRVDATGDHQDNGIVLGFCSVNHLYGGMPEVIGATEQFWSIGYDGQMWDGTSMTWSDISFDPATIHVGDWLACQVANGMLNLLVNDQVVATGRTEAPETELFPAFDLLGSATAVSFSVRRGDRVKARATARPSASTIEGLRARGSKISAGIAIKGIFATVGEGVEIDGEGGRTCINVMGIFSCVVVAAPLTPSTGDDYFEVTLDDLPDPQAGIVIGVSSLPTFEVPEVLCDRAFLWCIGYDGQVWDGSAQEWQEVDFDPAMLRVGDTVGLRVCLGKKMELSVNGHVVVETEVSPPVDCTKLYPAFDLLGARQVTFSPRLCDAPRQETMS